MLSSPAGWGGRGGSGGSKGANYITEKGRDSICPNFQEYKRILCSHLSSYPGQTYSKTKGAKPLQEPLTNSPPSS